MAVISEVTCKNMTVVLVGDDRNVSILIEKNGERQCIGWIWPEDSTISLSGKAKVRKW